MKIGFRLIGGRKIRIADHRRLAISLAEGHLEFCPELVSYRPDLIHAHELNSLLPSIVAGKHLGVPVVYDSHELEFGRNSTWGEEAVSLWTGHERELIGHADAVIAVSEGCAKAIEERYGVEGVTVVRNCPQLVRDVPEIGLRETIGLSAEVPLLVFVGKVMMNRGLEAMVEVLGRLPEFHLACVGSGEETYRRDLEELARKANVLGRLHFVPAVPPGELVEFISGGDVSVVAIQDTCLSYHFCLPNKLFESAHAGLPIVVSNLPDMREFVEKYEIGEVVEGDGAEEWAAKIMEVYGCRGDYYSPEKLARVQNENCAEREVEKVVALYQNLLESPHSSSEL